MSYNPTSCPVLNMVRAGAEGRTLSQTVTFCHFLTDFGHFSARVTLNESFRSKRFQDASTNDSLRQITPRSGSWSHCIADVCSHEQSRSHRRKKVVEPRNFSGGKTDNRDGRIGAWRRTVPERRRLVSTDHDRAQGETDEPRSPSASTAESQCVHEASGTPAPRCATPNAERGATWLTYEQAARYAGWSVGHLRNLVSAGQISVYGIRRRRRFRRDMLDTYLTDPDMAMRRFSAEGNSSHGR